ncbi:hypothetical protein [Thalassolituus sp. UBA3500]|uniref:hypothetical protein n=1 Tax=Thalassolituus sp. UBA3500 TaxID=1947664 RepID=UPI000B628ACA|nr:hypothetical protein [Thalassolituus sp. UBA3500]MBN56717.1 hypothetical protein [Oceanospirillaceae bacterium]OUX66189.1 MAG: hypothetical protein CBE36_03490 [Oceanospirillaceae bacterium TMED276]|tara:strand:- start:3066 stop:3833 length:768 start_codon:yes stop_codon:yes gene_type:complete
MNFPKVSLTENTATYCIQVNDARLMFHCEDEARYTDKYVFHFEEVDQGLISNPDYTGEIIPLRTKFALLDDDLMKEHPNWLCPIKIQIWPKSELLMESRNWEGSKDLRSNSLKFYERWKSSEDREEDDLTPRKAEDFSVLSVNGRSWAYAASGLYGQWENAITELSDNLVLIVIFSAKSCWPSDTYPPEGLKEHLMPFFTDYLSRIQITPTEGVPESELPPLGFYPSMRKEKEIDSEGNAVAEDTPASSSSEWGW